MQVEAQAQNAGQAEQQGEYGQSEGEEKNIVKDPAYIKKLAGQRT